MFIPHIASIYDQSEQSTSTLSLQTISTESQGIQERGQQTQNDRFPLQCFGNDEVFMKFKLKMTNFFFAN